MPEFPPTPEQQTILDAVKTTKSNLMIRARAGCGGEPSGASASAFGVYLPTITSEALITA